MLLYLCADTWKPPNYTAIVMARVAWLSAGPPWFLTYLKKEEIRSGLQIFNPLTFAVYQVIASASKVCILQQEVTFPVFCDDL